MNTVFKFPASKLPAELRGGFSDDDLVTVTVAGEDDEASYDLWLKKFVTTLRQGHKDIRNGKGKPADDVFANMRAMIRAKASA